MIKVLKYNEIDFEKYRKCLENSIQQKYCATQEFLNITAGHNWELLVYGDYEAVMPLAYIKRFGLKIVRQPKLCQQLGIFSPEDQKGLNDHFFSFLSKKYLVRYYAFNDHNMFSQKFPLKKNFLISPEMYEVVFRRYSPKRKRKIRQDPEIRANSEIKLNLSLDEVSSFILKHIRGTNGDTKEAQNFLKIYRKFSEVGLLSFDGFYYQGNLINLIAIYHDATNAVLLGSFNDHRYVKLSGASVLIDDCLRRNIASKTFDFEGGNLPAIEEFFCGFRPEMFPYPYISATKKQLVLKILRRFF